MGNILYGKIIVIADLLQAGNTCTFTSGSTVMTKTIGVDGIVEAMLPAFKRWEVEIDGYSSYVDLGCGECHTVNLALDKTTWQGIQNILDAHRETELLEVGDEVIAEIGGVNVPFQIAAINLYNSHEIIFISKNCVDMRQQRTSGGNSGGWSASLVRTYLNSTFKQSLPDEVKNNIKTFLFYASTGTTTATAYATSDDIWIPRISEVTGQAGTSLPAEAAYCMQYPIFITTEQRIKTYGGGAQNWWTASATKDRNDGTGYISYSGAASSGSESYAWGIVPCFRFTANN